MFKNYLKVAFRNILKHKFFSIINILGMTIGVTACLLIALYVTDELNYDRFHDRAERIYQVGTAFIKDGKEERRANTPAPMARAMHMEFPEIEQTARLMKAFADDKTLLLYTPPSGERKSFFETGGYLADSTYFRMLTYDFKEGIPERALEQPNSLVISEEIAEKLFGKEKALNKVIHISSATNGEHDFKVWKNGLYMFTQFLFKPVDVSSLSKYTILGTPASTNVRSAKYPQILPDNRVLFRIKAPDAQRVQVDLAKKYELVKDTGGYWTAITDSVSEGFHYYSLLIDGVAIADPASETFYGMGRMASGIEIPFSGGAYYAMRNVPHGDIRIKKYFSRVTNSWRQFYIYTPPA